MLDGAGNACQMMPRSSVLESSWDSRKITVKAREFEGEHRSELALSTAPLTSIADAIDAAGIMRLCLFFFF